MKRSLMRPTAALFPAVLLVAALTGNAYNAAALFMATLAIQIFSLCSIDSFRNVAAREPGVRRVDRRFSGTWPMILLGIAATTLAGWFLYGKTKFLNEELWAIIAGGCIIIEQLFEERMFALSRRTDGVVLSLISNLILLAGLLLDGSGGVTAPVETVGFYTICGTGLGMVISIAANYIIEPMHAFSLVPRNIGFFPKACVQTLLYPAIMLLFTHVAAKMTGLILWRLSRTVCRRAQDESRPLNLLLLTAAGAAIVAVMYGLNIEYPIAIFIALVCAAIVFCAPGWRFYVGVVLITGALSMLATGMEMGSIHDIAIIGCAVVAIILNLHKAFLRKV